MIFLAPGCAPCREEISRLVSALDGHLPEALQILLVSDGEEEETRRFLQETGAPYPAVIAPRDRTDFLERYRVWGTPSYCLVGPEGKVLAAGLDLRELEEEIGSLVGTGKEVPMA